MYCVTCEQERATGQVCEACGRWLMERERGLVEAELRHVQLLLRELPGWEIPPEAKTWVRSRYQRSERVLREVLGLPGATTPSTPASVEIRASADAPETVPAQAEVIATAEAVLATAATPPEATPEQGVSTAEQLAAVQPEQIAPRDAQALPPAPAANEEEIIEARPVVRRPAPTFQPLAPLSPNPAEAMLDVPELKSPERDAVEAVSTWKTVWRPFLYESIGWFLGAFLILAGTFYFVAESWSGMTSLVRALVVFGLSGLYSAAFAVGGRWLGKRRGMDGAGRALTLIGAAVAPLAALGLAPVSGDSVVLFTVLTAGWALATATFARWPAEAIDPPSALWTQLLAGYATGMLALGPLVAHRFALSADVVPVLLFVGLGWSRSPRKGGAMVFALCAPLYLFVLAAIRVHLAADPAPGVALYAPLGALWTFGVLRLREGGDRVPTPFAISTVALQLALCLGATFASNPSAAVCFTILAVTALSLARPGTLAGTGLGTGALAGTGSAADGDAAEGGADLTGRASLAAARWALWEYVAAGAGLLSVLSLGAGKSALLTALAGAESASGPWLPVALVLGYVLAVLVLASVPTADALRQTVRRRAAAAVLLSAGALATLSAISLPTVTASPVRGLFVLGALALMGIGAGLFREQAAWVSAGAVVLLGVPLVGFELAIPALPAAVAGLSLAALSAWRRPSIRRAPEVTAILLSLSAVALAGRAAHAWQTALAVALAGLALTWIGVRAQASFKRQLWVAVGGAAWVLAAAIALPLPLWMVLAVAAVVLAAATRVGALAGFAWVAVLLAPVAVGVHADVADFRRFGLMPSFALAALSYALLSVRWRWTRPLAALFATAALLPSGGSLEAGFRPLRDGLTPTLSLLAYGGVSLGASLWTALRSRSGTTLTAASAALCFSAATLLWQGTVPSAQLSPLLLWLAVAGGLASCRALPAWLGLGWASLLALIAGFESPFQVWAIATVLTAVAQLDRWPRARQLLFGGARVASVASGFALFACAVLTDRPSVFALVALCVYPLLWMRATRWSWLLATTPLLGAAFARSVGGPVPFAIALGVTVLATRGLWHSARVRGWLSVEEALPRVACWAALVGAALAGWAALVGMSLAGGGEAAAGTWSLVLAASALLLMAGDPLELRLGVAAGLLAGVPRLRAVGVGALALLPIALRRAGPRGFSWLGAGFRKSSAPALSVISLALAGLAMTSGQPLDAWMAGAAAILAGLVLNVPWLALASAAAWLFAGTLTADKLHDPHGWRWTLGLALFATAASLLSRVARVRIAADRIARWIRPEDAPLEAAAVAASGVAASDVAAAGVAAAGVAATDVATSDVATSDVAASDVAASDVAASDVAVVEVAVDGASADGVAPGVAAAGAVRAKSAPSPGATGKSARVLTAFRPRPTGPRDWTPALELCALFCLVGALGLPEFPGVTPWLRVLPLGLCALALLSVAGGVTTWLFAGVLATTAGLLLPPGFFVVGVSITAVACLGLSLVRAQPALLDVAITFAALALFYPSSLAHPSLPWKLGVALFVVWERARRDEAWHSSAWVGTLLLAHVALLHVGAVLSTGRPAQHVLPFAAAVSAACAVLALFLAGKKIRAGLGEGFAALALIEAAGGWWLISGREPLEGAVLGGALVALAIALAVFAVREEDAKAAYLAEAALFIGYLGIRSLEMGGTFGKGDALFSIVGGALLGGLAGWAHRRTSSVEVLAGPARLGAYLVPLAGLIALPWGEPLVAAALLVGNAAHFAVLARGDGERRFASAASVVAFNGALLLAWSADRGVSPELFLIPAGISLLMLVRVFREDLTPDVEAKLRAVAVTGIYASAAFRPLMFPQTWAFLSCVALCLLGVGVGIALRIRSYVYLGTAFLVTSVVANVVRFGVRDHRAGAAFLSVLGLLVVGSMILLSAKRAELLRRYEQVRERLAGWQA